VPPSGPAPAARGRYSAAGRGEAGQGGQSIKQQPGWSEIKWPRLGSRFSARHLVVEQRRRGGIGRKHNPKAAAPAENLITQHAGCYMTRCGALIAVSGSEGRRRIAREARGRRGCIAGNRALRSRGRSRHDQKRVASLWAYVDLDAHMLPTQCRREVVDREHQLVRGRRRAGNGDLAIVPVSLLRQSRRPKRFKDRAMMRRRHVDRRRIRVGGLL